MAESPTAATAATTAPTAGLTCGAFLAKMKDPAAADLVRNIKRWGWSGGGWAGGRIMLLTGAPPWRCTGPPTPPHPHASCACSFIRKFEERPAGLVVDDGGARSEADSAAVQAFLAQSERAFRQHPVWRGCQPEVLDQAVEVGAAPAGGKQ